MLKKRNLLLGMLLMFLLSSCNTASKSESPLENNDAEIAEEAAFDTEEIEGEDLAQEDFGEDSFGEDSFGEEDFGEEELGENTFSEEDLSDSFSEEELSEELGEEFATNEFSEDELNEDFEAEEGFGEESLETSTADLSGEESFEEAPLDNADMLAEEPMADLPVANSDSIGVPAGNNKIVGLDFLSNQNGGTIVISTSSPTQVKQRKNLATGQYIIEVEGVELPEKFRRPYDTREFGGAIGLFQAYQEPGSTTARFVVQLNDDSEPFVSQEGNSIMLLASKEPELSPEQIAKQEQEVIEEAERNQSVDIEKVKKDEKLLGEKSIEDFLTGNTEYYGKKINIELVNTDILRVFDIIAEQSNLNIVVSEKVNGKITLKLREIPWDQALMVVLQSKQLGYVKNGNILRIAPLTDIEKESEDARKVIEAQIKLQPVKVKIFPISYAKASDISNQVTDFLTEGRGKAKADTRTNSLIVTDVAEVLTKVEKLIKRLDTETPQVLMEAKFVEATETFSKDINLNVISNANTASGSSSGTTQTINFTGADTATSVSGGFFATFTSLSAIGNLNAKLDLYESRNLARVISSPRVVGLNNEAATITQTNQVLTRTVQTDGDTNVTSTTFNTLDLTTDLQITPQITAEGSILMDINVTRDVAGAEEQASGGATARPKNTRSAKTKVLVPNGDTVVIGGVYSFDNNKVRVRIPYLADIPLLGRIFEDETSGYNKSELMIFVTPRVLNIDKAFNRNSVIGDNGEAQEAVF